VGYVFTTEDAQRYEDWLQREPGRSAFAIEQDLLYRMWHPLSPQRLLEVGCGCGHFLHELSQQGHQVTGLDPSPAMLRFARRRLPRRVRLHEGYAEDLPYADNEFDTVALVTTLEFTQDPSTALEEACRVARSHVLLGVLNKYSLISFQRRLATLWKPSIYRHARFFSLLQLHGFLGRILGRSPAMRWRTCLSLPLGTLRYLRFLENSRYLQWHPFGHFIALKVDLRYRFIGLQHPLMRARGPGAQAKPAAPAPRRSCQAPGGPQAESRALDARNGRALRKGEDAVRLEA